MDKKDIEIRVLPEVDEFIDSLADVLVKEGYKLNVDYAQKYVDDIVNFIYTIPSHTFHEIPKEFYYHFERYGKDLYYVFYRRKSSPTTWYVFFRIVHEGILVTHISNNWTEGQYLR